ncbi:hypothetical protein BDV95DRAFT_188780 [Massariosphaeria phaeospora]|uniref:Uncharacterized protein n=1 Tax=Massariosphaeria phaeospora TaxID=100035 RepID=A0A7C8I0E3_9PLEO|nr:hypothetical protein BDV95DRAFT_188780 [Massariosphaeria phaeospora]
MSNTQHATPGRARLGSRQGRSGGKKTIWKKDGATVFLITAPIASSLHASPRPAGPNLRRDGKSLSGSQTPTCLMGPAVLLVSPHRLTLFVCLRQATSVRTSARRANDAFSLHNTNVPTLFPPACSTARSALVLAVLRPVSPRATCFLDT